MSTGYLRIKRCRGDDVTVCFWIVCPGGCVQGSFFSLHGRCLEMISVKANFGHQFAERPQIEQD